MVKLRSTALFLAAAVALTGCGAARDGDSFWKDAQFWQDTDTNLAMTAYVKGDYPRAEQHVQAALRRNPKDPYAILVGGLTYEATGRPDVARLYYTSLISLQPEATATIGTETGQPQPVVEIARRHLARIDGKAPEAAGISAAPFGMPSPGMGAPGMGAQPVSQGTAGLLASRDALGQMVTRFKVLKALQDRGLITPEEYSQRRRANVGALLPLTTSHRPADDLGRPAPDLETLAQRLAALGQSLELGAISVGEYQAERETILQGVLPANPSRRAPAVVPPTSMLEAADAVGRLERLKESGVIGADDLARERDAVYRAVSAHQAKLEAMASAPPPPAKPTGPGVHIASYSSEARARTMWDKLKAKHEVLAGLEPVIEPVKVKKKTLYRLNAGGGLADMASADKVCKALKKSKVPCRVTTLK